MGKEYRAKVFKSGNSLALRLPKDLGLTEGATMVLREEQIGTAQLLERFEVRDLEVNDPPIVPGFGVIRFLFKHLVQKLKPLFRMALFRKYGRRLD